MTCVLGLSAFYHDSAAALIDDGRIVAAAQEERFSRTKHDARFPLDAIRYVLSEAGVKLADVEHVAFYDKPFLKFERLLDTYVATAPRGFRSFRMAIPVWLREKLFLKDYLVGELRKLDAEFTPDRLLFAEHHFSHAASAFYPSPFDEAVVLTLDGVGEWATSTVAVGNGNRLEIRKELHFPHSLGLLYSAFTYYTGFRVNSGEYKLMGLAPYGEPVYRDLILEKLIDLKSDGSFRLDQSYFDYAAGLTMTSRRFHDLFGQAPRRATAGEPSQFHMDIAASVQAVTEEIVLRMARSLSREYQAPNLCLAGGVALNCVANGKVARDGAFENVWIQPAAGDAGGAVGAALAAWHTELENPRHVAGTDAMAGAFLGPAYSQVDVRAVLRAKGAEFEELSDSALLKKTAQALAGGQAVGWFQGRMEFGPRALGNRSILGDPRSPTMQRTLNLKVKNRESFRPFAPAVLAEDAADWFDLDSESPYMLLVSQVAERVRQDLADEDMKRTGFDMLDVVRSEIPAVTHVDNSARVQTVTPEGNPRFHALISAFKGLTGCPVLVNTSFNVRGEPVVCTPADAYRCFMSTDLDVLVVGNCYLDKASQPIN